MPALLLLFFVCKLNERRSCELIEEEVSKFKLFYASIYSICSACHRRECYKYSQKSPKYDSTALSETCT